MSISLSIEHLLTLLEAGDKGSSLIDERRECVIRGESRQIEMMRDYGNRGGLIRSISLSVNGPGKGRSLSLSRWSE